MPYEYDVFLSHNSVDKPAVESIAKTLQQKYNLKCWLDKWNLVPGEPWQEALEEALDKCQTVAVFVGSNIISPWENEEMRSALEERAHDKTRRVIPVLLPGSHDAQKLRLPRFLKRLTWVDFRSGLEDDDALHILECGIRGIAPGKQNGNLGIPSSLLRSEKFETVQLILEGEFSEFNEIKRDDLTVVLAALLGIDKHSVKILRTYEGSIIIDLELPEVGATRLLKYFQERDFRLKKLDVISVKQFGVCSVCKAYGHIRCPICNGKGKIKKDRDPVPFRDEGDATIDCKTCQGTGKLVCKACNGTGISLTEKPSSTQFPIFF